MTLPPALLAAGILLVCLAPVCIVLLRMDERSRRMAARRGAALKAFHSTEAPLAAFARLSVALPTASLKKRMSRLIGMDPYRRDPYRYKPYLVLPISLLPGYAVQWLLHGLIGSLSVGLMPLTALFVTRAYYHGADAKRMARLYGQFPDALATIVRAVRVGIPVTESLRAVAQDSEAPTAIEFMRLYDQVGIGTPLEEALREMAARNGLPEYRFFATALALQSQTGGGLTETLENLAEVVRKRVALKARGYALASEARTSSAVLIALPFLSGGALAIMNPSYIGSLFEEGSGQTVMGAGVVWLSLGIVVMRFMIRKSLS